MSSVLCSPERPTHQGHRRRKHGAGGAGLEVSVGTVAAGYNILAAHPFPHLSTWDLSLPVWSSPPLLESSTECKRSRVTVGGGGGGGGAAGDEPADGATPRKLKWDEVKALYAESVRECVSEEEGDGGGGDATDDGTLLVQQLIACAEAVACRDRVHSAALLGGLCKGAPVHGSPFQRVASCFIQGLKDRLLLTQQSGSGAGPSAVAGVPATIPPEKKEEGLVLAYQLCPYIQFGHLVANGSIMEALEGESYVHVVDLGLSQGLPAGDQWRQLVDGLVARPGSPPRRVRITGVGGDPDLMGSVGRELEAYAGRLGLHLEFTAVDGALESLTPESFEVAEGEALAVSSVFHLHRVVKESRGALNAALRTIHGLRPRVLALVEQDAGHNGPFFLGRFMEALHYYAAVFDALDAALPRYDTRRARVEQFHFGEEIRNIVSCEGPARVERHERLEQWRRRMSRAGFQQVPAKAAARARRWLAETVACEGYTVAEEKGCLVLGWKTKPLVAASCWKC
uniref:DELLA protein RGL2 n=1 Tax=Anthurium amnicola TaxID=1678845 RepID=A0A1D1Y006_9ARAE